MPRIHLDNRITVGLVIAALILVPLGIWKVQAQLLKPEFKQAVRDGAIDGFPIGLREKVWTDEELATVRMKRVSRRAGRPSLAEVANSIGQFTLPADTYAYQATMTDLDTGIDYVFGRLRDQPGVWRWAMVHPDSMTDYINQRAQEVEAIRNGT